MSFSIDEIKIFLVFILYGTIHASRLKVLGELLHNSKLEKHYRITQNILYISLILLGLVLLINYKLIPNFWIVFICVLLACPLNVLIRLFSYEYFRKKYVKIIKENIAAFIVQYNRYIVIDSKELLEKMEYEHYDRFAYIYEWCQTLDLKEAVIIFENNKNLFNMIESTKTDYKNREYLGPILKSFFDKYSSIESTKEDL